MYRDLIDTVVNERGFITKFSEEEEAAATAAAYDADNYADYRRQEFITIDGEDARDFDDAVSCRRLPDGGLHLTVAIADVSAYVPAGSVLDHAARQRGNSVYLPDRVIPMLPTALSNDLCSLKQGEDRLCLCCEMELSADGQIRRYRFLRAIICSSVRMNYHEAAAIMCGDVDSKLASPPLLRELAQTLRRQRQERGSMLLERPEKSCIITDDNTLEVSDKVRNIAHWAIEEAMIAANRCAADFLIRNRCPALHRVHNKPSAEKINQLTEFLSPLGIRLPSRATAADFAAVLDAAQERDDALAQALMPLVLGTLARAEYAPNETTGHFGLACERYTHFTSPIRRYPDLLTHRAIISVLAGQPPPLNEQELMSIGAHCGETEVNADKAGWESRQRLLCVSAQKLLGCEYEGYVSGMSSSGFFVTVADLGVDGMVRFSTLPGFWHCNTEKKIITSPDKTKTITITDKINVQLTAVIPEKGRVDFLASDYKKNRRLN